MKKEIEICLACKAARKARGVTLAELAAQSGRNINTLSKYENGLFNKDILQDYYDLILYESETRTIKAMLGV